MRVAERRRAWYQALMLAGACAVATAVFVHCKEHRDSVPSVFGNELGTIEHSSPTLVSV